MNSRKADGSNGKHENEADGMNECRRVYSVGFVLAIYVAVSCRPAGVKTTETIAFARVAYWRMRLFSTRTTCRRRLCIRNRYQGAIAIWKTLLRECRCCCERALPRL